MNSTSKHIGRLAIGAYFGNVYIISKKEGYFWFTSGGSKVQKVTSKGFWYISSFSAEGKSLAHNTKSIT